MDRMLSVNQNAPSSTRMFVGAKPRELPPSSLFAPNLQCDSSRSAHDLDA